MANTNQTPSILQVTIFQDSGLVLYHQSFAKDEKIDPFLFAGFTAGILAFSQQLGSEISTITLQDSIYYIKRIDSIIFVIGTTSSTSPSLVEQLIQLLFDNEEFVNLLNQAMKNSVISPDLADGFQRVMFKILNQHLQATTEAGHASIALQVDAQQEIQAILEELRSGSANPKHIAERLFGKEVVKHQEKNGYTETIINMLESILNSNELDLEPNVRNNIQELIRYLKDKWLKAATKVAKGLF